MAETTSPLLPTWQGTSANAGLSSTARPCAKARQVRTRLRDRKAPGKRRGACLDQAGQGPPATVNGKPLDQYFARPVLRMVLSQPLVIVNRITQYDLTVTVSGGGLSGQAGAVRHGLAKALTYFEPELQSRRSRRVASHSRTNSRVVERKNCSHRKAQASFQVLQALRRLLSYAMGKGRREPPFFCWPRGALASDAAGEIAFSYHAY